MIPVDINRTRPLAAEYSHYAGKYLDNANTVDSKFKNDKATFILELRKLDLNAWFVQSRLNVVIDDALTFIKGTSAGRSITYDESAQLAKKINKLVQKEVAEQAPKTIVGKLRRTLYNILMFVTTPFVYIFGSRASTDVYNHNLWNATINFGEEYIATIRDPESKYPTYSQMKWLFKRFTKNAFEQGISKEALVAEINKDEPVAPLIEPDWPYAIAQTNKYAARFARSQGYFPTFNRYVASATACLTSIPTAVHARLPNNPLRARMSNDA